MDVLNCNNPFLLPNIANGSAKSELTKNGKKDFYDNNLERANAFSSASKQNQSLSNRNFLRGRGRGRFVINRASHVSASSQSRKKTNENSFIYGNYHYYYGYRNHDGPDIRLSCLKKEWLLQKDVLDIGCNAGHFTLSVARDFSPRMIIGIDIDPYLVRTARKNAKHYLRDDYTSEFPISCLTQYGPMTLSLLPGYEDAKFPYNVCFVQGNYVLKSDELLEFEEPKFDTIFCLSVTKWIQLNWGDDGLKRMFMRMYAQLRNGGYLILEAQPYSSYKKKKSKTTETMVRNFENMQLFPEQYNEYLLSVVGFKSCELIDVPTHSSKGFSRPLYLFTKGMDYRYAAPKHIIFESQDQSDLTDVSDLDMEELSD